MTASQIAIKYVIASQLMTVSQLMTASQIAIELVIASQL
jgi:hypothetical protein